MYATVTRTEAVPGGRILAISDIHGNVEAMERLLAQAGFCERDLLVVVGDFLEKGRGHLRALRAMKALSARPNVRVLLGNCDDTIRELLRTDEYDNRFLWYVNSRRNTIAEMCAEEEISLEGEVDLPRLKERLNERYAAELDWLCSLPHILETQRYVFVHAGLCEAPLEEQPIDVALSTYDYPLNGQGYACGEDLRKIVVVGHEPTPNFQHERQCHNPYYDASRRILAIDGGNVIKSSGQLNLVALPDAEGEPFTFWADDAFPRCTAPHDQRENIGTLNIRWGSARIERLTEGPEFSCCVHCATGHRLWIPNSMIYPATDGTPDALDASNATDYLLNVRTGEELSLIQEWSDRFLAKRDGVVGWVMGRPGACRQ